MYSLPMKLGKNKYMPSLPAWSVLAGYQEVCRRKKQLDRVSFVLPADEEKFNNKWQRIRSHIRQLAKFVVASGQVRPRGTLTVFFLQLLNQFQRYIRSLKM